MEVHQQRPQEEAKAKAKGVEDLLAEEAREQDHQAAEEQQEAKQAKGLHQAAEEETQQEARAKEGHLVEEEETQQEAKAARQAHQVGEEEKQQEVKAARQAHLAAEEAKEAPLLVEVKEAKDRLAGVKADLQPVGKLLSRCLSKLDRQRLSLGRMR